jgi:outer membrane protein assembly factor BamB
MRRELTIVFMNMLKPVTLCSVSLLSLASLALAATGDWPEFRGPNRDNISQETGLLKQWPSGGPPVSWTVTGLGDGYSGVAVVGDRIYSAGDRKDASYVMALNRANGSQVWAARLGKTGPVGDPKFEGPRGTPTVDGNLVFALGQWGDMICLEAATGKELWRKDLVKDFNGTLPQWGYAESPLVDGDKVVVTPGGAKGTIVALDKKTGAVIWQSKELTDPAHYSSIVPVEYGGVRQYVQLTPASVAGVAATDGKLLWRASRRGNVAVIPTPIFDGGLVYVTSSYGAGCNLFKVTAADGKFTTEQVYANKVMANHHGGVIKVDGYVYGYSEGKGWTCQDFKTGEARWQEKEKLGKGSLAYADGCFYLRQEGGPGTVALIQASPEGYKELGRFGQPSRSGKNSWPHPVIAGGKLYLRDQDVLLCYDIKAK